MGRECSHEHDVTEVYTCPCDESSYRGDVDEPVEYYCTAVGQI